MHGFKLAAFAAAITVPLVQAQAVSLASFPKCAQNAAASGLASTNCDLTDFACICRAVEFVTTLTSKIQASCGVSEQQATLSFAQGLCGQYGVTLHVPAVAAAANAPSSPAAAAPAQAASSAPAPSLAAAGTPEQDMGGDDVPSAGDTTTAAAASSAEPMSSAPVSPDAFPTSAPASLDDGPLADNEGADGAMAATTGEASPPNPTSVNSKIVYDTKSVVPSAIIASYPMSSKSTSSADASPLNAQVPTSTTSYRNSSSTANSTVAASSPIPYVGAAIKEKVQGAMLMIMAVGMFWGL
ncbi:MAG: hypothetical protein Q9169_002793 [Polycauliona sp. 2 TL-2023]